ncbi:MAG: hypothetical protein Q9221_002839 [Calogaya cf. arnoldii]
MKREGLTPDRYISGNTIHGYLNDFAKDHDLVRRIRLNTTVSNIDKADSGIWRLDIKNADGIKTKKLIAASGVSSDPYTPSWPKEDFNRPIVHSAQVGTSLETLQSPATDRVVVDWIIREDGSGPLAIMPPRILGLFNTVDVMATRALASFSPDFWKVFYNGNCTVHRTNISSFSDNNHVNLKDGTVLKTDCVILCTGWTHNLGTFKEELREQCGLPSKADHSIKWQKLDAQAEDKANQLLPSLADPPDTVVPSTERRPWRLYRRLDSPAMAAQGDRSFFFPGQICSVYTPLVAEFQALWGVPWMLGWLQLPGQKQMEEEVSLWNACTGKRYLEQGRKHSYSIYDYLAYIDTLAKDRGNKTNRKSNQITEMFASYRPRDYNGLTDEYLAASRRKGAIIYDDETYRHINHFSPSTWKKVMDN